ncbi:CBS domain-containing protein [Anaeromyxobacter sp. PSR-1]|uniref:CBS domain-containing protein n=1 Tax=unclassified Anaeromyxobacter TaxID=2620896 RepID=UPI0005E9AFC2|nr:CBS domain-containing protein [Anaeromyxobacter sp. PSR-1]GAO01391.1 CBS domain-containing protein YhcV [Anaeromyxobacter sp. PSR-1]
MTCDELMTRDVLSVRPLERVDAVARRMRDENLGFAPVCTDDGRPVGAVTDRDIALRVCAEDRRAGRTHVEEIMTRELLTCRAEDDVRSAEERMEGRRKHRILVLDREGRLAGVISLADLAAREDAARAMQTIRRVVERERRT